MDFKDYYATLGVAKTATEKEIKQAYRKLARKLHPDVNPGDKAAEARFKEINEAYEVLGDPDKRKKYDELGANWRHVRAGRRRRPAPGARGAGGAWNVNVGGAGGGGFRTMTEDEMREMFGDGDPFSDFFHTFFGGALGRRGAGRARGGARGRGPRKGRDVEQEIELGARRRLPRRDAPPGDQARRPRAHGRRADSGRRRRRLARPRRRRGRARRRRRAGRRPLPARSGWRRTPTFERKGQDLYTRVAVPLTTAVLGGEAEVPTLGGQAAAAEDSADDAERPGVPAEGPRHAGRRASRPSTGDLYATVDVQLPRTLTPEQRDALRGAAEAGSRQVGTRS